MDYSMLRGFNRATQLRCAFFLAALALWFLASLLSAAPLALSGLTSCPASCAKVSGNDVEHTACMFACNECTGGLQGSVLPGLFRISLTGKDTAAFSCWATSHSWHLGLLVSGLGLVLALVACGLYILLVAPTRHEWEEDDLKLRLCYAAGAQMV